MSPMIPLGKTQIVPKGSHFSQKPHIVTIDLHRRQMNHAESTTYPRGSYQVNGLHKYDLAQQVRLLFGDGSGPLTTHSRVPQEKVRNPRIAFVHTLQWKPNRSPLDNCCRILDLFAHDANASLADFTFGNVFSFVQYARRSFHILHEIRFQDRKEWPICLVSPLRRHRLNSLDRAGS
jgi:hypothetical protein